MTNEKPEPLNILATETLQMWECASMALPTITITTTGPDMEQQELVYLADIPKKELSTSLSYELGPNFKPSMIEKIVETVENKGFLYGDFEIGFSEEGFKCRFSRTPKKTIKTSIRIKGEK